MSIQFPDAPFQGQSFVASNGVSYTYDNGGWIANSQSGLDDRYVNLDGDSMTGDLTVPSLNGGQLAGFRNQIINGDFYQWQRGSSVSVTGTRSYTADRWNISTQSTASIEPISDLPGFRNALKYETTNAVDLRQGVELPVVGRPCQFYIGSVWTLSFWIKSETTGGGDITAKLYSSDSALTGGNAVDNAGAFVSLGTTTTSWQRVSQTFTITSEPNTTNPFVAPMIRVSGTDTQLFCGIQLEPGPVATPFEHRPIGTELALCQRYFYPMENAVATTFSSGSGAYDRANLNCEFPVEMRALPTITFTGNGYWVPVGSSVTPSGDVNGGITGTAINLIAGYKSLTRCQFSRSLASGSTLTRGVTYNSHSGSDRQSATAWADAEL